MADFLSGGEHVSDLPDGDREPIQARVRADGARQGLDYTPPVRIGAFKSAGRHTTLVRILKRTMILGSILGVTGIGLVAMFNPFRHFAGAVSIAGVGVSGTTITMELPKISGVQQGGGAYEVKAKAGIQDITKPKIMDLVGVDASVGMADATTTHITSERGRYDSWADSMVLSGDVKIANTSGYTLNLQSAFVDFRGGWMTSHERLRVDINGGKVAADAIAISNDGHVINFKGNINSVFEMADDEPSQQARADVP